MARLGFLLAGMLMAVLTCAASVADAGGLPRRDPAPGDRAMVALAESLRFKLARPALPDHETWAALVNETMFVAQHLGLAGESPVSAMRFENNFVAVIPARGVVSGADPDLVLGRLLYFLASDDPDAAIAAPVAIADQSLSATLAHLVKTLR